MSDFISSFWGMAIAIVTIVSILACLALLVVMGRMRVNNSSKDNTTGHVWDGDLSELNNPLPLWWVGLFVITIVFGFAYLYLYPGLGENKGSLAWAATDQYAKEMQAAERELAPLYASFQAKDHAALADDSAAMQVAERLFLNNCAQCHGSDARGAKGFPNLTDADWLYGGTPEVIQTTIAKGRHGQMPAMGAALGSDQAVLEAAQYVLSLSGRATDKGLAEKGKERFAVCAACHGPDGKGNQALGAPNLTDNIWLHGGSLETIVATITKGRDNQMPAWESRMNETQIKLLAAYVWRFSNRKPQVSDAALGAGAGG
jgi:cytochrome c oxidase cbb3-type subunit 3